MPGPTFSSSLFLPTSGSTVQVEPIGYATAAGFQDERARNLIAGTGALNTGATNGFAYTAAGAGAPVGVPAVLPTGSPPLYVNTTAGTLSAYYGAAWNVVGGGAVTLQAAYNGGTSIATSGAGAVTITNTQGDGSGALAVNKTGTIANLTGAGIAVTMGGTNTSGAGISIAHPGNGSALTINQTGTAAAIVVGGGTAVCYEMVDGSTASVGGVTVGRMRYNTAAAAFQVSVNGGAYATLSTGTSTLGSAVNAGNVVNSVAASGQITWATGGTYTVGATSQIFGPTDSGFFITAGTPAAGGGNSIDFEASPGGAGSQGGAAVFTAGSGTNSTGGILNLNAGACASGTGSGGPANLSGGAAKGIDRDGGTVSIIAGTSTGAGTSTVLFTISAGNTSGAGVNSGQTGVTFANTGYTFAAAPLIGIGANAAGSITGTAGQSGTGTAGAITWTAGSGGSTSGAGGIASFIGGAGTVGNSSGGVSRVVGGAGAGSSGGGFANLTGGVGGATGNGGDAVVTGGAGGGTGGTGGKAQMVGGAGIGASQTGGAISIISGASGTGNASSGDISISNGTTLGNATAGSITGTAGQSTTGTAGAVTFTAGAGGSTSGAGGIASLVGGAVTTTSASNNGGAAIVTGGACTGTTTTGAGGAFTAAGGLGGTTSGTGGAASVTGGAGQGSTSGAGGLASLSGGAGSTGSNNNNAGNATISTGNSSGSGTSVLTFKVAPTQGSGAAVNTAATALTLTNPASGKIGALAYFTCNATTTTSNVVISDVLAGNVIGGGSLEVLSNLNLPVRIVGASSTGGNAAIVFDGARGTLASATTLVAGDAIGTLNFQGATTSGTIGVAVNTNAATLIVEAEGSISNLNLPSRMTFSTTATTTLVKRLTIDSAAAFKFNSAMICGWVASASDPTGSLDTGISRIAAGVFGAGTGAAGSTAGSWEMNGLSIGAVTPVAGQVKWFTGFGTITHLQGPTDQPFALLAGTPAAGTGNGITLTGSVGVSGSAGGTFTAKGGAGNQAGNGGAWVGGGGASGTTSTGVGGAATLSGGAGAGATTGSFGGLASLLGGAGSTTSSDNNAGGVTIGTGISTGLGGSNVRVQTSYLGLTGSTAQPLGDRLMIVGQSKVMSNTTTTNTNFCNLSLPTTSTGGAAIVRYCLVADDLAGTNVDVASGWYLVVFKNVSGTVTATTSAVQVETQTGSSGSIASGVVTATISGTNVLLNMAPVITTIVPTKVRLSYNIECWGNGVLVSPQ
jgi:hypothetical protein